MASEQGWMHVDATADDGVGADVREVADEVDVRIRVRDRHAPAAVRASLVDALFELPAMQRGRRLHATVPLGESEIMFRFRKHCPAVTIRAAGATCLLQADLPDAEHCEDAPVEHDVSEEER